jgi:putative ABC transport system permease protein
VTLLARLALRNLLRHRWRTLATVLGVALGIAAVLATSSVGANVQANLRATLQAAVGPADLLVTPGATGRAVFEHADVLLTLQRHPSVAWAVPTLVTRSEPARDPAASGVASLLPGIDSGFQLSGRVTDAPATLPIRLTSGRLPAAGAFEVVIAADFAASRRLALGEAVGFSTPSGVVEFTLVGLIDDGYALGSTNGGRIGVTHLNDLQLANGFVDRASHIEVALRPNHNLGDAREALQRQLGEQLTVTYPATGGDATSGIVQTLQAGLSILAATLLALGGFMAYNTFMAGVVERTREYALLRTICMRRRDILRLALWEAGWVSIAGVALGLLLGIVLSWLLTSLNSGVVGYDARTLVLPWSSALLASGVGVAVALFAGSLPARLAARTSPLTALRNSEPRPTRSQRIIGWTLVVTGAALTQLPWSGYAALVGAAVALAIFFVGVAMAADSLLGPVARALQPLLRRLFGPAGTLGAGFTVRNSARNGVAIGSVIVGAGLIVAVGGMIEGINDAVSEWLDTTIVGDLFVTSAARFPNEFEARAAEILGIDQVSGVGLRAVRFEPEGARQARTIALILVDPQRFNPEGGFGRLQYIAGMGDDRSGYETLAAGGRVLAANTIHDRFGVGVGDSVRLRTDQGFETFEVGAVVVDFTGGGETFLASLADLDRFGAGSPDLFVMTVLPGEDPGRVRDRLREAFPELLLDITLNTTYRSQIEALIQGSFSTTNALLALAAIIAALGVSNTLGMNLSRRAHEIAVLRTVGMRRSAVARLVVAEGMLVLTLGAVLGLAFGLLLANVVTAGAEALTGYVLRPRVPWHILAWAGIFIPLLGLLASYLPARRAAQLSPRAALGASEAM